MRRYHYLTVILVVLCFIFSYQLKSQFRLDNWKAYTSLIDVGSVSVDKNGNIWAGTSGGAFKYNPVNKNYEEFRNINAFLSNQITKIAVNPATDEIYAGTYEGYLEIFKNGKWNHITDIKNQKFPNSEIKSIVFKDNKAYIAGGFGLAVFDAVNLVFIETVRKYGNFSNNTPTNEVIIADNKLWVATDAGIASAPLDAVLANPDSWTNYTMTDGLYDNKVLDIAWFRNNIYSLTANYIHKLENGKFSEWFNSVDPLNSIASTDGSDLYFSNSSVIMDKDTLAFNFTNPASIKGFEAYKDTNGNTVFIIYYKEKGIGIYKKDSLEVFIPSTVLTNNVRDLTVDIEGNLWVATDILISGRGFAKFDGKTWFNFDYHKYPYILGDNSYHRIAVNNFGKVAVSNYGKGLLVLEPKDFNYSFSLFNQTNSELRGVDNAPAFIVAGDVRFDNKGNIWVVNLGNTAAGPALVAFDKNLKSYGFENPQNRSARFFMSLGIDYSGTKWVGGSSPNGVGLMYFNEMGTLDNPDDDISGFITTSNVSAIPDNIHNSIEVDKSGFVWIGTPRGLAVIMNPSAILKPSSGDVTSLSIRSSRLLGEQNINDIMIDALNNKWIATSIGVWVLNADGSDTLAYINTSNSPLPTNEILALATDQNTGKIYFASKFGIYEATSLSVLPNTTYNINCYPQPFDLSKDEEMVIDGLAEFSEVRILTTNGELVKNYNTTSRKIIWDGRNKKGNLVSSGIYLIVTTSSSSKESSVQKVAVIGK
jgi:ligand-binding sensor domain-containing protein